MSYIRNTSVQEKWHNGSVTKKKIYKRCGYHPISEKITIPIKQNAIYIQMIVLIYSINPFDKYRLLVKVCIQII